MNSIMKILVMAGCICLMAACSNKQKNAFMEGCAGSGGDSSICSCTYDKMEDQLGKEELRRLNEYPTEENMQKFTSAAMAAAMACKN